MQGQKSMTKDTTENDDMKGYKSLVAMGETLEEDLKVITNIYGKITSSHDYKELSNKTNQLRQNVESRLKEVKAKLHQWDQHFKAQQAYKEMLDYEAEINRLCDKYM